MRRLSLLRAERRSARCALLFLQYTRITLYSLHDCCDAGRQHLAFDRLPSRCLIQGPEVDCVDPLSIATIRGLIAAAASAVAVLIIIIADR